jgi:hypothetical protein
MSTFSWRGVTSDYNTPTNWFPAGVPDAAGETADFGAAGSRDINVSAPIHPDGWRFSSSFTITGSPGAFVDLGESSLGIDSGSQTISVPLKELGGLYKFGTGTLTSRERIATTRSSQSSTGVQLLSGRTRPSAPGCSISRAARRCWRRLTGSPSPTPSTLRDKEQPSSTPKQTTSPFRARSRILQPVFLLQVSWRSLALAR